FDTVGVGVKCSLCGQPVSEQHARAEARRLADEVREWERKLRDAEGKEGKATEEKKIAEGERDRLDALAREQFWKCQRLADLEKALTEFGVTADAGDLREEIGAKIADADDHGQQARVEEERRGSAVREAERLDKERQETAKRLFTAIATEWQQLAESGV